MTDRVQNVRQATVFRQHEPDDQTERDLLPPPPAIDPFSLNGVLILANQLLIGLAMGLAMRIVFAAIELAGELVALTMGLNFATFFDPQNHGASSVVSQFLLAIGTLTFLTLDGHLLLLSTLAESFRTLPLGASSLGSQGILGIAEWGSTVFSAAMQLSLPMVAALLVASASLGILTAYFGERDRRFRRNVTDDFGNVTDDFGRS